MQELRKEGEVGMTEQEAVQILNEQRNRFMDEYVDFGGVNEAFSKAIYSLQRQEPKTMTEYDDGWDCPSCGLKLIGKTASGYPCDLIDLPDDEIVKFCPVCGQAVKWE